MIIPQLPVSKVVEPDGYPTSEELIFRQNLQQALQLGASEEGLVAPTQSAGNITTIQNNTNTEGEFTCQGGTLIYNSTTNELQVCILVAGVPTFKTVTVT
jgi:hypothetical protein